MSRDDAHWSDRLLLGARASAEPGSEAAARNLAGIEARLGGAHDAGRGLGRASSGRGEASRPLTRELGVSVWRAALVKAGLVLSFGLATGVIGYWLGRADSTGSRDVAFAMATARAPADAPGAAGLGHAAAEPAIVDAAAVEAAAVEAAAVDLAGRRAPRAIQRGSAPGRARPRAVVDAPRGHAPARPEAAPAFGLSDALELLRRAEGAVRRSDGLAARMWLGDLDRRAPRELLLEERLVTQTLADCLLGDLAAAGKALSQLEGVNPRSMYRARLEGSCVAERLHAR